MLCCCFVKLSSEMQLWLIRRPNCITNFILIFFYLWDLMVYSIWGPKEFLQKRSERLGKNFAGLGKIVVGEYDEVAKILENPQLRSHFLGRARLFPRGFSKDFLLFLSDEDAVGERTNHADLHNHFWRDLAPYAQLNMEKDTKVFQQYLMDGVRKSYKQKSNVQKNEIHKMTIRYILHAFLGAPMTDNEDIVDTFDHLFFSASPFNYILGSTKPFFFSFLLPCFRGNKVSKAVSFIFDSPLLSAYTPNEDNANLSKEEYARLLLDILGIAGIIGTGSLLVEIMTQIPDDAEIDVTDEHDVAKAVLEAARRRAPVNNINVIIPKAMTININGKPKTIKAGTVVAGSIGLASLDPGVFPNPNTFDHHRENLLKATMNFNSVGYSPEGAGKRTCPGRTVAVKMASAALLLQRAATQRSKNGKDLFYEHPTEDTYLQEGAK